MYIKFTSRQHLHKKNGRIRLTSQIKWLKTDYTAISKNVVGRKAKSLQAKITRRCGLFQIRFLLAKNHSTKPVVDFYLSFILNHTYHFSGAFAREARQRSTMGKKMK